MWSRNEKNGWSKLGTQEWIGFVRPSQLTKTGKVTAEGRGRGWELIGVASACCRPGERYTTFDVVENHRGISGELSSCPDTCHQRGGAWIQCS